MTPAQTSHPSFGTLDDARAVLEKYFGYSDFRPPQIRAVEAVLSGRDALLVLPTGGGKSICYQVPALVREGLTIVVSPLISLMKDQVDALERRGISATFVNSTLSQAESSSRMARVADGSVRMLYLAPERIDAGRTLQRLQEIGVALLAVDEAHCISEWGHDFRPSYRRIGIIREQLGNPQTVALTATATPHVRNDIARQLRLEDPEVVVAGFDRTNLIYHVVPTSTEQEKDKTAIALLHRIDDPAVVYAQTRKSVERLCAVLIRGRIKAIAYHAGLKDDQRQRAQDAFMNDTARVIVATSAFGMGIDKPNVRLVVHHSMSGSLEAYYQEAGRAGRDGALSTCVLLHSYTDRFTHEFFLDGSHPERSAVEQTWRALLEASDSDGMVSLTAEQLAQRLPRIGERKVGAALRVIAASEAMSMQAATHGKVWVRLLATPARITRELQGDRELDRELLRAMWRYAGHRLESGDMIALNKLGLGGSVALIPVLDRLQSEQFVAWSRTGAGFRLDPRCRATRWLPVDWKALEVRRKAEFARLDAMEEYALTSACRRAFVLRYFGIPQLALLVMPVTGASAPHSSWHLLLPRQVAEDGD